MDRTAELRVKLGVVETMGAGWSSQRAVPSRGGPQLNPIVNGGSTLPPRASLSNCQMHFVDILR